MQLSQHHACPGKINLLSFQQCNVCLSPSLRVLGFNSFFTFTVVQVVMAVYQMHQAASLDLVSLNVLKQLQFNPFYELFSLQGLDVRFFVLRRSTLFTLGDKKRLSAVMSGLNKRTSRNIRLL